MKKSVLKLNEKLDLNGKLLLESLYSGYINGLVMDFDDDDFGDLILKFVDFRLDVSGGSEKDFGMIGMNYIESFFDELSLVLSFIDDWSGQYGGDWNYENLESFKLCLDNLIFELDGEEVSINDDDKKLLLSEFINRFNIEE
jgi:hypothetical protein